MGDVAGFVGYDKFEKPKYLDSVSYGYKAKRTMLYGMENLPKYYDDGYCFFTEGPMCALWLRQEGFNALSTLGSYTSPYVNEIINRFGPMGIMVPDTDLSGNKWKKNLRYAGVKAQIWQMLQAKDTDDARQLNPEIKEEIILKLKNPFRESILITSA